MLTTLQITLTRNNINALLSGEINLKDPNISLDMKVVVNSLTRNPFELALKRIITMEWTVNTELPAVQVIEYRHYNRQFHNMLTSIYTIRLQQYVDGTRLLTCVHHNGLSKEPRDVLGAVYTTDLSVVHRTLDEIGITYSNDATN